MAANHGRRALQIVLLLAGGLTRVGLALYASSAHHYAGEVNSRLFRNPELNSDADAIRDDVMHIELDSKGTGRLDEQQPIAAALDAVESTGTIGNYTGPQVVNGGFETGSETKEWQLADSVPGWSRIGSGSMFIMSGNPTFHVNASHGDYLLGLRGQGSGVFQSVGGHVVGQWYRLMFHAAYCSTDEQHCQGEAKLKVSVDAKEKFNEAVPAGTLNWYEVTYQAPYADIVITFEHSGPTGDRTAFLDGVDIKPAEPWDIVNGNAHQVLLQKVTCNGFPAKDTCTRGRFLSVGGWNKDGSTTIMESSAATESAVWVAIHQGNRWSFQSNDLRVKSTGDDNGLFTSGQPVSNIWYLHADYDTCEARNWMARATSTFDVRMSPMGLHEVSAIGTECGSLFAIQKFEHAHTVTAR